MEFTRLDPTDFDLFEYNIFWHPGESQLVLISTKCSEESSVEVYSDFNVEDNDLLLYLLNHEDHTNSMLHKKYWRNKKTGEYLLINSLTLKMSPERFITDLMVSYTKEKITYAVDIYDFLDNFSIVDSFSNELKPEETTLTLLKNKNKIKEMV
ncbi:MAG: hypothetical protein ACRCX8_00710 [Sarcina sp.]